MEFFKDFLAKAKVLTGQGRLMDATRAIQQGLGFDLNNQMGVKSPSTKVSEASAATAESSPQSSNPHVETPLDVTDMSFRETARPVPNIQDVVGVPAATPSSFTLNSFGFGHNRYAYRLFIPSRADSSPLPLVVMLHGCKQDSDDFAKGTAMNRIAEREKFMVLYPEQLRKSNTMGCWNWFDHAHQTRTSGEPAMIAALSSLVIENHKGDQSRVYVAGLSAGAAMAAWMGRLFPEMFAAVGVHSGLAPGSARDMASAFSAMSRAPSAPATIGAIGIPVIVFHGTSDATVAPSNADVIVRAELKFWSSKGKTLSKNTVGENSAGARPATKSVWTDEDGNSIVELWSVNAGTHAWSGGDSTGSFTDPTGPSASEAMVKFFALHPKT